MLRYIIQLPMFYWCPFVNRFFDGFYHFYHFNFPPHDHMCSILQNSLGRRLSSHVSFHSKQTEPVGKAELTFEVPFPLSNEQGFDNCSIANAFCVGSAFKTISSTSATNRIILISNVSSSSSIFGEFFHQYFNKKWNYVSPPIALNFSFQFILYEETHKFLHYMLWINQLKVYQRLLAATIIGTFSLLWHGWLLKTTFLLDTPSSNCYD